MSVSSTTSLGSDRTAETTESEASGEPADIELPNPEEYSTSSGFKQAVYDQIEDGVPSWIFDLKLEITWRKANDVELDYYMKEVLEDEA